jgi:hypothetical protein
MGEKTAEFRFELTLAGALSDWADVGTLVGTLIAVLGVGFVVKQLRSSEAVSRAQATMQFQQAFKESAAARKRLLSSFPVHTDVLSALGGPSSAAQWATWSDEKELSAAQKADAAAVINAMNDVAQYVSDGLSLRSALQQYHSIFIRAGVLLCPYVDERNAPGPDGTSVRWGRRIPLLYNVALDYHHLNPKHAGKRIVLERDALDGSGKVELSLCGDGLEAGPHLGFPDDPLRRRTFGPRSLRSALRSVERQLRP